MLLVHCKILESLLLVPCNFFFFFFCMLLSRRFSMYFFVQCFAQLAKGSTARKIADDFQETSSKDDHLLIKNDHHLSPHMDPSLNVFFTINDLLSHK